MAAVMRVVTPSEALAPPAGGAFSADATVIERSWTEPERFSDVFDRYYAEIHGYVSRRLGRAWPTMWPLRRS
jgi:hypothetical protein